MIHQGVSERVVGMGSKEGYNAPVSMVSVSQFRRLKIAYEVPLQQWRSQDFKVGGRAHR